MVKKIFNSPKKNIAFMCMFVAYVIIAGIVACKLDTYGVSVDEPTQRNHCLVNFKYLFPQYSKLVTQSVDFNTISDLQEYWGKYYGVAIQMPIIFLEAIFDFQLSLETVYNIRHIWTFLIYSFGILAIGGVLYSTFNNRLTCVLGVGIYILNPIIFASAFYNIKDTVFMSVFSISLWGFFKLCHKEFKNIEYKLMLNTLLLAFLLALLINVRTVGGILALFSVCILVVKSFRQKEYRLNYIKVIVLLIIVSFLFWYLITPAAWENPISFLIGNFRKFSNYTDWDGTNFYMGQYFNGDDMPWHYVPIMILITTPIIYILFYVGGLLYIKKIFEKDIVVYSTVFGIIVFTFLYIWIFHPILYTEWRHFYYLHPCFVLIISAFIDMLINSKRVIKFFTVGILLISSIYTSVWMIYNHPYEYMYFNVLVRNKIEDNFERDYWKVASEAAIRYCLQLEESENIVKVYGVGQTVGLSEDEIGRLWFCSTPREADYIIEEYIHISQTDSEEKYSEYNLIYEKCIDGISAFSIYTNN